jgi:hypothetical protein
MPEDNQGRLEALKAELGDEILQEIIEAAKQSDIDEKARIKKEKTDKEKADIEAAISSGNYRNKKDKVAFILSNYPATRNSDISLSLKFWEIFQKDLYDGGPIESEQLFKLERQTSIARIRAKIQNEYGLYQAEGAIKRRRKALEEDIKQIMGRDVPARPIIQIYADETGKNASNVIVGSVWFLEGIATARLFTDISDWKDREGWNKEFHFTEVTKRSLPLYIKFIEFVAQKTEYMSFKVISTDQTGSRRRIEEIVLNLYRYLILRGAQHEIETGRATLPREISLTIDEEQSIDGITIADLKQETLEQIAKIYNDQVTINSISTVDSKISPAVQIADLISGAVNRRLNHDGERNHKDVLSDYIIEKLAIDLGEEKDIETDAAVFLSL